ncbi:MAG: hypothetical protein MJE66_10285, partial [Proteobacteria bacterium]|nr:hypothetical protein [Pseudomonadota bacterium]
MSIVVKWGRVAAALVALAMATPALAQNKSLEERVSELEKQREEDRKLFAEELDFLRKAVVVPEDRELISLYGLGPAASKVYQRERGLSIGGYGEVRLRGEVADETGRQNNFDALRAVMYFGYKFNDWLVFNSELEFEHAGTGGGGSVSTEFLTLDFLLHESFNIRAGLLLVPMGFVNEIHEPTFFFGAERPEVERRIIPSTWRENGAGIFGSFADRVNYRIYVVNGFDASGFSDNGLRGGRQKGSEALSDHFAVVARADVLVMDGLTVGGSVYTGQSGQNQDDIPDTPITIWEVHSEYKGHGLSLRALWAQAHLQSTKQLSAAVGSSVANRSVGGYGEVAFDVLSLVPETKMSFEPFYRYEHLDTQDNLASGLV